MTNLTLSNGQLLTPLRQSDHVKGLLNGVMTLVVYGDYQCPRSAQIYETVQGVYSTFKDQLCVIYRHYPRTPERTGAWKAAEAAEAASVQGKFWEMHDLLYQNSQALEDSSLVEYADQLGLDIPMFLSGLASHTFTEKIKADRHCGDTNGVLAVPTYFVNIRSENPQHLGSLIQTVLELDQALKQNIETESQ